MERTNVLIYLPLSLLQTLLVFLYAETHYRFKYFFSFLRKHEPEIIADAPHRLDPGAPLPLLVLFKDAHLFPATLKKITVLILVKNKIVFQKTLLEYPIKISEKVWWQVYEIPLNGLAGKIECDVEFEINDGRNDRKYHNDNYRTSSRLPLHVYVSKSPLPKFDHLYFGECHSHSMYTDDQVEFGSPLDVSVKLSQSIGLSFFCVTDHSYDLDDSLNSYLQNDPEIPKWRLFQTDVDRLNSQAEQFAVVRGEEVTCRTIEQRNIHLLLLGNRRFFHGSGDSAENWSKTRSEHTIVEILNDLEPDSLAYAAHPMERISFLQRLLLGRGKWEKPDFVPARLSGIQFLNGQLSRGSQDGYQQWIAELLKGKKIFVLAGNDAHGNFNRFRQIGIPFLKILEREHQLFGKMRTGVFLESLSESSILSALKLGKSIVTDGPVANLLVISEKENVSSIGSTNVGIEHRISLEILSTSEYGSIHSIKIFKGIIGSSETVILSELGTQKYIDNRDLIVTFDVDGYLRTEIWTSAANSSDRKPHFCFTNPIWFSPETALKL